VILPDVNLLVHAYNQDSPAHRPARRWLEDSLSGEVPVGFAWAVLLGFLRLTTQPRVLRRPLPVATAVGHLRAWLAQPPVFLVHPGDRHAGILFGLLERLGTSGNLTTDAHLAALAVEHQAELLSTDADFARFPGLRWRNPLGGAGD
jgi:toxin-antitoxin system PIN domain toxin